MTHWNALAIEALLLDPGPLFDTRAFSILHASIHDALNTIAPRYEFYTRPCDVPGQDPATASPEAAIAAAARHVLVTLSPSQAPVVQAAYDAAVAAIPEPGKSRGIALGQDCAEATLARRDGDGSALAHTPVYVPTTAPGDYDFTPPFAFAAFPGWGRVEPFGIDLSQHALRGPDPLDSLRYALDYNIVKRVGERDSRWRSRDQTETAFFWYEGSPIGWNRIANIVLRQRGDDLWKTARVLALVNFAIADGFIAGFEAKYHFRFWRPITAIPRGAEDGNPLTAPDAGWLPLLSTEPLVTPPVPDYPSTHTVLGAAAAAVLIDSFGDRVRFSLTSSTLPGVTRRFRGFTQAAVENGLSRVYGGIHFLHAVEDGYRQGTSVGKAIARLLPPVGPGGAIDREDSIEPVGRDVYWLDQGTLRNPVFTTPSDAPLYSVNAVGLDVTWGEFRGATAASRAQCVGGATDVRVHLEGLIPNGVYSLFYGTFTPNSVNPLCPGVERLLPLTSTNPSQTPDAASFIADANGAADVHARVNGCLLDASQVFLSVIYHFDGMTYGDLPNRGEFITQGSDCRSSFGEDAMRQITILQKW